MGEGEKRGREGAVSTRFSRQDEKNDELGSGERRSRRTDQRSIEERRRRRGLGWVGCELFPGISLCLANASA